MKKNKTIAKTLLKTSLLMLIWLVGLIAVNAQTNQPENEPLENPSGSVSCEMWILYVDDAAQRSSNAADSSLILIVKSGSRESSRRINIKRLKTLKEYILYFYPKAKIIIAEGERTKDSATVEFYVKGKLLYSLPVERNEDVALKFCRP